MPLRASIDGTTNDLHVASSNTTNTSKGGSAISRLLYTESATCVGKDGRANISLATFGAGKRQPLEQIDDLLINYCA